jgi:hypothetical protein
LVYPPAPLATPAPPVATDRPAYPRLVITTRTRIRAIVGGSVATVAAALVAGCGGVSQGPTVGSIPAPRSIEGIRWEPVSDRATGAQRAFLTFDDALSWHGSDGCTEVHGSYQYFADSDGRVVARAPEGDLRGLGKVPRCAGVPTASALGAAAYLRISGGRLLLISAHNQVILRLEPTV